LLIVHGGGKGARAWRKNAESLSKNFRVYIPDLPGFGYSESANGRFDLPDYIDFVANFAEAVGIDSFYLMGHSIGGGISLHYALQFPQKVKGLVLISSWCLGYETALWIRFLSQPIFCKSFGEAGIAVMNGIESLVRRFHPRFKFDSPMSHVNMDIGTKMINLKGQTTVLLNRLSQLLMPTMLVWGSNDPVVPAHQAYTAGELIPDCEVHIFRGCGHSVYRERIEEFSQLFSNFTH
jgi:pimeloyl-ACP methyl ester carboxylesterase